MQTRTAAISRVPVERPVVSTRRTFEDVYFVILALCLVGYATMGKGFAYLGIPPVYIGDIMLIAGVFVAAGSGGLIASFATVPSIILLLLAAWTAGRVCSDIAGYGIDALRDSVIVIYGGFAFIVASLLIAHPRRIDWIVRRYHGFVMLILLFTPAAVVLSRSATDAMPSWSAGPPLIFVRSGELAVHLAGVAAFILLGFRKPNWILNLFIIFAAAIVFAQNRGGMLAFAIPVIIAAVFSKNVGQLCQLFFLAALLAAIAILADVNISLGAGRNIQVNQILANIASIFGDSSTGNLDGTKEWRMRWWETIIQYTVHGDYFWFGKGFGPNLAVTDGFVVGLENGGPLLRSPHNAHLTVLARSGVPGLMLWALFLVTWFGMLIRNAWSAWRDHEPTWARFFGFIACYALAAVIDATFDVALEGPMIGIWFWVLIGIGLGSSMVYWSRHPSRSALRFSSIVLLPPLLLPATFALSTTADAQILRDSCPIILNRSDVEIDGAKIDACVKHGIEVVGSRNITIRNVTISNSGEFGIRILHSDNVTIYGNTIINSLSSVYAQASRRVHVRCNSFRDVRGPIPRGQFVQFNEVHGPGNSVACNFGVNEPTRQPEDAISMYRSSGTPDSPILIEGNTIVGGGPSMSGGGIMLGDDGGSHLVARNNILEDPGQYGIGVAAGHNIEISGNVITARSQPFTNVGISVWKQYPAECRDITVKNNIVRWISRTGRPNPWWTGENCGAIQGLSSNNFEASLADIEQRKSALRCGC